MSPKTETDHIVFLLAIINHTESKPDYDAVSKNTGLYKNAKCVKQALDILKKKYADAQNGVQAAATASDETKTTKFKASSKKRATPTGDDRDGTATKSKKTKTDTE